MSHPTLEDAHAEHHIVGPKVYGLILLVSPVSHRTDNGHRLHKPWRLQSHRRARYRRHQNDARHPFLHARQVQSRLIKLTVAAGFFTFLVLITMTLSDYISRAWGLW